MTNTSMTLLAAATQARQSIQDSPRHKEAIASLFEAYTQQNGPAEMVELGDLWKWVDRTLDIEKLVIKQGTKR
jgi:hypothetical protein